MSRHIAFRLVLPLPLTSDALDAALREFHIAVRAATIGRLARAAGTRAVREMECEYARANGRSGGLARAQAATDEADEDNDE